LLKLDKVDNFDIILSVSIFILTYQRTTKNPSEEGAYIVIDKDISV